MGLVNEFERVSLMNPQLNVLKQHNLLIPFEQEVLRVASNNWQSSHEFKNHLKGTPIFQQLLLILQGYHAARGFGEPASFIGSVCSHLSKQGHLKHSQAVCPIKNSIDDVFRL